MSSDHQITIRELYPDFTEEELKEAEENLRGYLGVLIRMAERLHAEGRSINDLPDLTPSEVELLSTPKGRNPPDH
jgi:hypothetical protein